MTKRMASSAQEAHIQRPGVVIVVSDDVDGRSALLAGLEGDGSLSGDTREAPFLDVLALASCQDVCSVPLVVGEAVIVVATGDASVGAGLGTEAAGPLGWFELDPADFAPHHSHSIPWGMVKNRE